VRVHFTPTIRGLSFVDDIRWFADGKDDRLVVAKLSEAAVVSIDWAAKNGVAFDHGKTKAAIFRRKKAPATARVKVGANTVPFDKQAARWLGVWLDSQLALKDHHANWLKNKKNAMARLRRPAGQMGLPPTNCEKAMTACIQSVAMFVPQSWWKRPHPAHHRSGKRAAAAGQPGGACDQEREVVGAPTTIGKRLENALECSGRTESIVLLEGSGTLEAKLLHEEEAEAKAEA